MKLRDYLAERNLTAAAFGRQIGLSRSATLRLVKGTRRPSWPVMEKIEKETGGAVLPNDFADPPAGDVNSEAA